MQHNSIQEPRCPWNTEPPLAAIKGTLTRVVYSHRVSAPPCCLFEFGAHALRGSDLLPFHHLTLSTLPSSGSTHHFGSSQPFLMMWLL